MFIPYEYQQECIGVLGNVRRNANKALVVMASGLGKTATTAFDFRQWVAGGKRPRLLYLCHQNEILAQAHRTFEQILGSGLSYGYYHGTDSEGYKADCLFASFQTLRDWRLAFRPEEFGYIVVDEGHHSSAPTYRPVIDYFEPAFLLGITATPDRSDLQDIRAIYGEEVFNLPLEEALARGFLTAVDYRVMVEKFKDNNLLNQAGGRISIRSLNQRLFVKRQDEEIAKMIEDGISDIANPRVMVFCPSIDYCERLSLHLPGSLAIHSDLSETIQKNRLEYFRSGELMNTVLTVDKFNEGVDVPEANVVVFLRSTNSETIFWQQLGRGLRKAAGKDKVCVLDFVANCERLEMVHALWKKVGERHGKFAVNAEGKSGALEVNMDVGSVLFEAKARSLLDVIARARIGYSKEVLAEQLRGVASELGKFPSAHDIDIACWQGKCASVVTYTKVFGSIPEARKAAKLTGVVINARRNKPDMIRQLQELAKELGRSSLKAADIVRGFEAGKCPSDAAYRGHFGSISTALEAAGLQYDRGIGGRPSKT
ncbi:MAG: DEAD/DEAH box helicase family protein [Candidatus Andersenbacteria bacterium]